MASPAWRSPKTTAGRGLTAGPPRSWWASTTCHPVGELGPLAARLAQCAVAAPGRESVDRRPQGRPVAGTDEQPGLAVDHHVGQASDRRRDDGAPVRHRLGATTGNRPAARGTRRRRRARRGERAPRAAACRAPAEPLGAAGHHRRRQAGARPRRRGILDALLRREAPGVEDLRRLGLLGHLLRDGDSVRHDAHVAGAQLLGRPRERARRRSPRARRTTGRASAGAARQARVRAVQREDEGGTGEPVGSQCACTTSARRAARRRAGHRGE